MVIKCVLKKELFVGASTVQRSLVVLNEFINLFKCTNIKRLVQILRLKISSIENKIESFETRVCRECDYTKDLGRKYKRIIISHIPTVQDHFCSCGAQTKVCYELRVHYFGSFLFECGPSQM